MKDNRKRDTLFKDLGEVYDFIREKSRTIHEIRDHFYGKFESRWLTSAVAQLRLKKLVQYNGTRGRHADGKWEAIEKLEKENRFAY